MTPNIRAEARRNLTKPSKIGEKSTSPSWMSGKASPHNATAVTADAAVIHALFAVGICLWTMAS
jgi:hypothetical protein